MSSNQKTQARSMNGIIEFEGENINATSITAETITTQDLEITNNLLVATKNISPVELSFLDNTTSNIQNQLNDKVSKSNVDQNIDGTKTFLNSVVVNGITAGSTTISNFEIQQLDDVTSNIQAQLNNKVDLTTSQNIGGNKNFVNQVSLNDDLIVNSKNISPLELSYLDGLTGNIQTQLDNNEYDTIQIFNADISLNSNLLVLDKTISPLELSYLDGLQDNIQTQLDNAGISNAMTLNTNQTATGQKFFTQPLGFPSVVYSNQTGSLYGIKLDDNTITSLAQAVQGVWATGSTVVNGIDATSVLSNVIQFGTNYYVGFDLTDNQPKQSSFKSTYGYVNDTETGIILLDATNLTANNNPSIPLSPIPSGLIFPRWNSSTYITQADFVKTITNNEITLSNQSLQNVNQFNYYYLVKQKSTISGYLKTSNQIIKDPTDSPNTNDFLEETNLSLPTMISSINGNVLNLSSTNTAQSSVGSAQGYFTPYSNNTFYYYNASGLLANRFVDGNNDKGFRIFSWGSNAPNGGDFISLFGGIGAVNSYSSPVVFTRTGYMQDNQSIVIKDMTNIVLNQSVQGGTGIYEGWNFITSISNNEITFNNANAIPTLPPRVDFDGYLYSNSELITSGVFLVNDFVVNPSIGSKICQAQGQTGQVVILNETSTITPTPNNKTYNGFSLDATTFYFRDDTTNVYIDYYLKDNSIPTPTVNHLITNVDTVNKTLTTSNLPNTTVSSTYNGYANINLNQIITTTSHNVSVNDGIFSTLNSGIRFVSAISPEYYQGISVYGSLNFETRLQDTQGICIGNNLCVVYDPNGRLVLNDFLVDYDSGGLIPPDCIISTITSIGFDFYNVEVSSQGTFTQNTQTRYNTAFRPQAGELAVNATGLNDKIWKSGSAYRFITGVSADPRVYTTNDTGNDFAYNDAVAVNIICEDDTRHLLWYYVNNTKTYGTYSNKYLTNSVLINASCFASAGTASDSLMNGSTPITIQNLTGYTDFNYGNGQNNPYFVGYSSSSTTGNAYLYNTGVNGIILLLNSQHGFNNPYQPITGDVNIDVSIINNPNLLNNIKAKKTRFTGLILDQTKGGNQTGNAPIIAGLNLFAPASVVPTQAPNLRYLYTFYNPNTPLRQLIFTQPPNVSNGSFVIVVEPNFRIQSCTLQFYTNVVINGITYYQYQLSQAIYPPHPAVGFQMLPSVGEAYNLSNPKGIYTFNGMMMRPSLAGNGMNLYHTNLRVDVPDNQSEYEVVDPQPLSIYKSLDSYNSYEKTIFQQITPINDFKFTNSETIEFYDPVSYDLFTGLSIDFYNTSEYTLNSDVDLTFPLLPSSTEFVMQDAVQDLYNKTLQAPTFRTYSGQYPTFADGLIQMTALNNYIFYDNQFRIQHNQGSVQNVSFRQTDTIFFQRPYSTNSIHLGGVIPNNGGSWGYNQKLIIGDDNWTFGVDNGVRGLGPSDYYSTIAFYGSDLNTRKFRIYNSWNANTIFVVDRDGNVEFGNTGYSGGVLGYVGYTGYLGLQHSNLARTGGNYAILQDTIGNTFVNSSASGFLYFRRNNSTYMYIDSATLKISTPGISYEGASLGNHGRNQMALVWGYPNVYCIIDNVAQVYIGGLSDRRTKKNIVDYTTGLEDIMKLRPRKYNVIKVDIEKCDLSGNNCIIKDCSGNTLHYDCSGNCIDDCCEIGDENVGLILDEVKEHFPYMTQGGDENSIGSVSYYNMVPMLIQAVQTQQKQIEELQKQINSLLNT